MPEIDSGPSRILQADIDIATDREIRHVRELLERDIASLRAELHLELAARDKATALEFAARDDALETKFQGRDKAAGLEFSGRDKALQLDKEEKERRLDLLNHEQARLAADRERYLEKNVFDEWKTGHDQWRDGVNTYIAQATGNNRGISATWSVMIAVITVLLVVGGLAVNIASR